MSKRVTIIGAGPAGSAAAILLARKGSQVTLIEQHRFPRDKVCGECLSADGIAVLDRLGLGGKLKELQPAVFVYAAIHAPGGRSVRLPLPSPMWGLSRQRFDSFLLETARECGATILQPARCESIESDGRPLIRVRLLDSNQILALQSDYAIVADGKGTLLRSSMRTGDFGIKAHFEDIDGPRDTIELFGCKGLYGGLAAIEEGRWNVAFSVPEERLRRHRGSIAAVFAEITSDNRALLQRMSGARQVGDWLTSPLPRFAVKDHWPAGIVAAGNATAALEPIGGEGMGLALRSAEQTASFLLDENAAPLVDQFRRLWRVRRASCRAGSLLVSRPAMANLLPPLLQCFPAIGRMSLRLLGK